ncbi:MAG: cytochrome P450 [Actinomycetota bacterium]|nr:cytochrome P450 [Actinomycetota bacterium]
MSANTYHAQRETRTGAPPGCPVHAGFDPLGEDYLRDPYPQAAELRELGPLHYAPSLGYVVVTRMEDVEEVFCDPDTYASVNVQDPVFPLSEGAKRVLSADDFDPIAVMSNRPEPDHGRIRAFTRQGFSNRRMKVLEPYIRRRSHELIDDMVAAGSPTEFVRAFAFPLPGETIFRFIGFPESDDELLKSWCGDRKAFSWGHPDEAHQTELAEHMLAYWRYCRAFTADKAAQRGDDFASELLDAHDAEPEKLTYQEVESIIYGLSFAGHEAVTSLICNSLLCLLPRRDQWDAICADPSLIPNAVEEVLRFESSQVSWRRVTTRATTLAGVELPEGTPIFLNFASANRQPDLFGEPDTFDIRRENARNHISFGKGIHFCLGARMARFEDQIVLETLAERLPSLRLVDGEEPTYFPNITFRGPQALHVAWD